MEKTVKNLLAWMKSEPLWSEMPEDEFISIERAILREGTTFTPTPFEEN